MSNPEGQVLDGIVKNITDYGAFIDLGGVDGYCVQISEELIIRQTLQIGETIKVQVIRFNSTPSVSLVCEADPWGASL